MSRYYECTCAECGGPINEGETRFRFIGLGLTICSDCVEEARMSGTYDDGLVNALTRRNDDDEY